MEQSRRKKYENYHISAQKRNRCFFSCVMAKMLTLLSYSTGTDTKIVCIYSDTLKIKYRIFVKVNGQDDFAELQITEVLLLDKVVIRFSCTNFKKAVASLIQMLSFYSSVTDEDILTYYSNPNCKGVPFRASSYLGVGVRRVLRIWENHGKEPHPLQRNTSKRRPNPSNLIGTEPRNHLAKLGEKDLELIVNRYDTYHGIPRLAARSMPYRAEVIRAAWMQAGKEINKYDSARIETPLVQKTYWG